MDNQNKNPLPEDDTSWLDELLASSTYGDDILKKTQDSSPYPGVDDEELEKILRETLSDEWNLEETIENTPPIPIHDEIAAPAFPLEDEFPDEFIPEDAPEEAPEEDEDSLRKVRPKKKNGYGAFGIPHLLSTLVWILLIAAIGVSLGRLIWVCATDVLAFGREDRVVTITITPSDAEDINAVANKLYNAGLIEYKQLFLLYAQLSNAQEKISAGTYELNSLFDYNALVKGISASSQHRETIKVTIPEGYTCAQIFALLEEKGVCSAADLKAYEVQSDYWFLEGVDPNAEYPLEGFLFPNTYQFYTNDTPKRVFIKLLGGFESIFTDELKSYIDTLNEKRGTDYTMYEIMIIASMIEKESASGGENYKMSSVMYSRLEKPSKFPTLNVEATVIYAQGGKSDVIDYELDSPYNTYKYPGLPPTPICNPSLLSIQAALNPSDTKYYYYVLNPETGMHDFS